MPSFLLKAVKNMMGFLVTQIHRIELSGRGFLFSWMTMINLAVLSNSRTNQQSILLDDGEPCVCVQSISFSLMCHWFRVAVLPLDGELAAALLYRGSRKRCAVCGAAFVPKSNRGKYCPGCAGRIKKIKAAERKRKQRQKCHALEPFKPA